MAALSWPRQIGVKGELEMKRFLILLLLLWSGLSVARPIEGTRDGGGGVGVRCPGKPIELLDLHEARLHGIHINEYPDAQAKAVELTSRLFATHMYKPHTFDLDMFKKYISEQIVSPLFNGQNFVDEEGKSVTIEFVDSLPLASDVGHYDIAADCSLEQIAFFYDQPHVLKIVRASWDAMDWLNKSMFGAHELVYLFNRQDSLENYDVPTDQITSEPTRRFVGLLFSVNGVTPRFAGAPELNFLLCSDADNQTVFNAYDSGDGEVTIVFDRLAGRSSSYEVTTKVQGTNISTWWQQHNGPELTLPLNFVDEADAPSMSVKIQNSDNVLTTKALSRTMRVTCDMEI
jgi:hypothetical protein